MDNFGNSSTHEWATPVPAGVAGCIGGVVLAGAAVLVANDPAGSVLMGIAGVLLLALGVHTLAVRPRLAVTAGTPPTLTVRTLTGRRTYTPDHVERIRLLTMRRIGRRTGQLEIDVLDEGAARDDARLLVFSRWDLGTDLLSVVDDLRAAGFRVDDDR
ncbi:PH domain-containing protein [Gordonia aurantiaca]|uniref:PH domain-containing protein n=1 Tax=Gordonia sp. B21 TaxID=3151852 RepID=UPI003266B093